MEIASNGFLFTGAKQSFFDFSQVRQAVCLFLYFFGVFCFVFFCLCFNYQYVQIKTVNLQNELPN